MTEPNEIKTSLYTRSITCPVCQEAFRTTRVKTSAIRTSSRESDFYARYVGDDPTWYEVYVCPNCGYSGFDTGFQEISPAQIERVRQMIQPRWNPRDFGGPRTIQEAIEAHMLALVCYQVIGAKRSALGKISLRLAWLYRTLGDAKEKDYLEAALKHLQEAYTTERLDEEKSNEINIMYLMGELSRRLGYYPEASRWFSTLLEEPELKKNRLLLQRVREQMSQTREDYNRAKGATS